MKVLKPIPFGILCIGLLVGVGLTYWGLSQKVQHSPISTQFVSAPVVSNVEVSKEEAKAPEETSTQKSIVVSKNKNEEITINKAEGAPVDGTQVVELKVISQVRLRISKDGGAWVTETLSPDSYKYRFQKEMSMFVYDAGLVEASYNGDSLGLLGLKGNTRRIAFKSSSLQESKE